MTDPQPLLRIDSVTRTFGDVYAVDDVSLDIRQGELFCLLGGSGSGKSTLLRMLSGFDAPSRGRIVIDGQDMAGVPPHRRDTNMMFQSYALFPHMTVERNIAYGLRRAGIGRAETVVRVREMLELVQLDKLAGRKPDQLSGGQRQRVALARALARRPKLLLLDEPLGSLDKKPREETELELKKIQETLGITFIVVTHDQEEAMTLADRMGVMQEGRIVQVGTPREIYEFPRSRFVAGFIGTVNLFDGTITQDRDTDAVIDSPQAGGPIRIPHAITGTVGQSVTVALRPEKLVIGRAPSEAHDNHLSGQIRDIVYQGGLSVFHVTLDTGMTVRVTRTNRVRDEGAAIAAGDRVALGFSGQSVVVLPS